MPATHVNRKQDIPVWRPGARVQAVPRVVNWFAPAGSVSPVSGMLRPFKECAEPGWGPGNGARS